MAKKKAIKGFSRVKIFPVTENTSSRYTVGVGTDLGWAQSMTLEPDVTSNKVYADDMIYSENKSWNGLNSTITLVEMPLEKIEELGFGKYDTVKGELEFDPQGLSREFALSFRCLMEGGEYRMRKMYSFMATELRESGIRTKGEGNEVNTYQLMGIFTKRKVDDKFSDMRDGDDMTWLDTIESVTA